MILGYPITTIKVVAPTAELLGNKSADISVKKDKEICSNASDYGSEDTFMSLGTKIKARAQLGAGFRAKPQKPNKNALKYRNIAKKGKRPMDDTGEEKNNDYEMEIKITERQQRVQSPTRHILSARCLSPSFRKAYETYFLPFDTDKKMIDEEALAGRVSFGSSNVQAEVEQAIDTYSRRLTLTKQQLSLVEEESTQDVDATSQHMSSLSPENSLEGPKKDDNYDGDLTGRNTYVVDTKDESNTKNFVNESRTYTGFYDDFCATSVDNCSRKLSSTAIHTDSSSKDSGYPDSGANDDKGFTHNFSLPTTMKKSKSHTKIEAQPKSLDSASNLSSNQGYPKTHPGDRKSQWVEPLNHSRLLYKDFFLQKEGHIALPPHNSTVNLQNIPNEVNPDTKPEKDDSNIDYPSYLLNSTTKAYTSKVIEDYKRELETINNLHELTLKDIRTDAISPTPFNIDKMFEEHSEPLEDRGDSCVSQASSLKSQSDKNKNTLTPGRDISKVSTKELIQNYLKVKEGDFTKDYMPKSVKKYDKRVNSANSKVDSSKQDWNNKNFKWNTPAPKHVNIRNQTQKNLFTMQAPVSARLDSVQNDKDVDSWMSLSAPSPRILQIDNDTLESAKPEPTLAKAETPRSRNGPVELHEEKSDVSKILSPVSANTSNETDTKSKELNPNSTVLDIYSMLKEIESFGENPVTSATNSVMPESPKMKKEEITNSPKDHFMEIFDFLEKVEQSASDALAVVTISTPQTVPK